MTKTKPPCFWLEERLKSIMAATCHRPKNVAEYGHCSIFNADHFLQKYYGLKMKWKEVIRMPFGMHGKVYQESRYGEGWSSEGWSL